jgi:hypothetical protein
MEQANFGFGEPRFIFYPPLSWILGAALTLLLPWKAVPSVFVVVVQTVASLSMYALARRFFPQTSALLGAALFATNPYALLDIYNRGALAEEFACALIPLVVLGALELCGLTERPGLCPKRAVAFFAAVFAAVWLSDVPAAIMISYSVAFIFAWAAVRRKSFRPLVLGAIGLALGFVLNSFYLLPVLCEQHWASVKRLLPPQDLLAPGNFLSNNFLFYAEPLDPEAHGRSTFLPLISNYLPIDWIASNLTILLLLASGIAGILMYRRSARKDARIDGKMPWAVILLLSVVAMFLMMRPSWILWKYLPKLMVMQFPWRWMGVLAVPYALLLAGALSRRRKPHVWGVAVMALVGGGATILVLQGWRSKRDLFAVQNAVAMDQGVEGAAEYYPATSDLQEFLNKSFDLSGRVPRVQVQSAADSEGLIPSANYKINKWTAEEKDVLVSSLQPVRVALRLLDYPTWLMEINGKTVKPQRVKSFGQVRALLPAGKSEIRVRFTRTPDRIFGNALSIASLLALVMAYWTGRARAVRHVPQDYLYELALPGEYARENTSQTAIRAGTPSYRANIELANERQGEETNEPRPIVRESQNELI